jgi:hypothetical protein
MTDKRNLASELAFSEWMEQETPHHLEYIAAWDDMLEVDKLLAERKKAESWTESNKREKDERTAELARIDAAIASLLPKATAQTATPAPVVTASDGPTPLTTGDIAFGFAGLRWEEQRWKDTLGELKSRKWLQDCVAIPGKQGGNEARWNPVLIGAWLVHQGHVKTSQARVKFQTVDLLKPWFDAWKTYEADNFDTP